MTHISDKDRLLSYLLERNNHYVLKKKYSPRFLFMLLISTPFCSEWKRNDNTVYLLQLLLLSLFFYIYSSCIAASANLQSSWRGWGLSKSRSWLSFDEYGHTEAQIWDPLGGKLAQQTHSLATFTFCTTSCVSTYKNHSGTLGFEVLPQRPPLCTLTPKQELLLLL